MSRPGHPASRGDALLVAARVLLIIITAILLFSLAAVCIGTGALVTVWQGEIWRRIGAADAPAIAFWAVIAAFVLIAVSMALAVRFFQMLHQIVASVQRDNPFDPANAQRLRRMGWLSAGVQLLMLPLGALGSWLAPYLARLGEDYRVDLGLDPAALLLILVLFILARVFERGSELRQEVEGTV